MKKIFKIALLCAAVIGALVSFSSCSKDSMANSKLIGKWQAESMSLGEGLSLNFAEIEGAAMYLTFHRDGTYLSEMIDGEDQEVAAGTWEYTDGVLKTVAKGVETLVTVSELTISKLVIVYENKLGEETLKTTLTLKKVRK